MSKLHLGCGLDYKEGYINIDSNRNVKADVYLDLEKKFPFKDSSISEILTEGVVEHISKENIYQFFEECWRVCKHEALIKIFTNHFTSTWAFQHLDHQCYFGMDSFGCMQPEESFNGERYNKARFKINKVRLHFFYPKLVNYGFLTKIPLDWMFNFSRTWQRFMERFQFLGFDGIYYELQVIKSPINKPIHIPNGILGLI